MFNCKNVSDSHPSEFLSELKKLSPYPLLEVPIRQRGITRCEPQRCYWNASIISQTFGGEVVFGWVIESQGNNFTLTGHGMWLTPEGKLVDVTPNSKKLDQLQGEQTHRVFLPIDRKLVLNAQVTERLMDLIYAVDDGFIECIHTYVATSHTDKLNTVLPDDKDNLQIPVDHFGRVNPFIHKDQTFDHLLGKLLWVQCFPYHFAISTMRLMKESADLMYEEFDEDKVLKTFAPHCFVIEETEQAIHFTDPRNKFHTRFFQKFHESIETGKSILELCGNTEITNSIWCKQDGAFDIGLTDGHIVPNVSLHTGKGIFEYSVRSEVVESHKDKLPRNKSRKKKITKTAKKYGVTELELLTLSNPLLFPHPTLINKFPKRRYSRV